ncbi:hypothetical protein [Spirosoma koreense]
MSDNEFALACYKVRQLDFVNSVNVSAHAPNVYVELSPRLVPILPSAYHVLVFDRSAFAIEAVLARYEQIVAELRDMTDLADQMLRLAKIQVQSLE